MRVRPLVAVVGAVPPPVHGVAQVTRLVLDHLGGEFDLVHVDTSDTRAISTVGRLDLVNLVIAIRDLGRLVSALARRPDVVYLPIAHNRLGFLRDALLLLVIRLARTRAVVHFHGAGFAAYYESEPRWIKRLARAALPRSAHIVVLFDAERKEFERLGLGGRVHVVSNGVSDLAGTPRQEEPDMLLFLSHVGSRKGIFELLDAIRQVRERRPVRLVVAGDWYSESERASAYDYIAREGLTSSVEWFGPATSSDKSLLLARAAALVFPSPSEGQGLVLLEAFAAGTPVVATSVGGIPDTVGDAALLVKPRDADDLAAALERILGDDDLRAELGARGRARYERMFRLETFTERLASVWRTALRDQLAPVVPASTGDSP